MSLFAILLIAILIVSAINLLIDTPGPKKIDRSVFIWFLELFIFALPSCFAVLAIVYIAYKACERVKRRGSKNEVDRLVERFRSKES